MLGSTATRSASAQCPGRRALGAFLGLGLALAIANLLPLPALARAPQATTPPAVEAQVRKFGVGKDVKVTLVGGERLRGHIASIGVNTFTVRVRKSQADREIAYNQVALVKDPGPLVWILIGAAIVIIIIVAVR
jgi:hypothetical protein